MTERAGKEPPVIPLPRRNSADRSAPDASAGSSDWSAGTTRGELPLQEVGGLLPTLPAVLALRRRYYERVLARCGPGLVVRRDVLLRHTRNISIGRDVFINHGVDITAWGEIEIGDDVLIGPGAVLHSGDHEMRDPDVPVRLQGIRAGRIVIEDDVWIGAHAVVTRDVRLGRGCVVAAGAVVTHDVPPYAVVGGVPAQVIGTRRPDTVVDLRPVRHRAEG